MLKKTIKYTDYNGQQREEDFYFNLNKAELAEMEMSKKRRTYRFNRKSCQRTGWERDY